MNKYVLSFVVLLMAVNVWAQKKPVQKPATLTPLTTAPKPLPAGKPKPSFVHLIKSDSTHKIVLGGKDITKIYRAVFQQDYSVLRSDSAYFYEADNAVDAFGHVVITQGDTIHIYSDKLNYNGNTKIAILTDNVKMVDKDATLTTNFFNYNTGTKYGTYTGGGKLVNKDNTLISQNGYYFASTRDSYFRYNVVLTTKDAVIKNDTLRYNSGTRIAYFYGPTNIYGKDKDTLYTEHGTYDTQTEQAFFDKKNQYRKGTKSLLGDTLFYDRLKGYGQATKNVVFTDKEQKVIIKGGRGEYTKSDERMVMTRHPYVVFITEDSVKKDTAAVKNKALVKNTMPLKSDSLLTKTRLPAKPDSAQAKNKPAPVKQTKPVGKQLIAKATNQEVKQLNLHSPSLPKADSLKIKPKADSGKVKRDSIYMSGDTIETQIITYGQLKYDREQRKLAGMKDSTIQATVSEVYTKPVKVLPPAKSMTFNVKDYLHPDYFPKKPKVVDSAKLKAANARRLAKAKATMADSVYITTKIGLSDTARVRILIAAHHAKIFKSDLQAVADSIFFSYADSIARMYYHPMIWSQGSQLSGDTINLQMKNKKIDNVEMFPSAFIVNVEKGDSVHFNQVAGKKMRAFFKENKVRVVFVDGNGQTLYYDRDSVTNKVTNVDRSIAGRMKVNFGKKNNVLGIAYYTQHQDFISPATKLKEDDKILKGFLWKPKDRPASKEAVINPPPVVKENKKGVNKKGAPDKKLPAKADTGPAKPNNGVKLKTDSLKADTAKLLKPALLKNFKPDTSKLKKQ